MLRTGFGKSIVKCKMPLMHFNMNINYLEADVSVFFFFFLHFSDKILNKDGKRENEKTILRERLFGSWLHQKQLEKEVIKHMLLQWGKHPMPSDNLEATNEYSKASESFI